MMKIGIIFVSFLAIIGGKTIDEEIFIEEVNLKVWLNQQCDDQLMIRPAPFYNNSVQVTASLLAYSFQGIDDQEQT